MLRFTPREIFMTLLLFPIVVAVLAFSDATGPSEVIDWRNAVTVAALITLVRFIMLVFEHRGQQAFERRKSQEQVDAKS